MKDVGRGALTLSAALASLAGFVDAVGFLDTGGLFVSFMSGTSTQGAVSLPTDPRVALVSVGIVSAFVVGVAAGGIVSTRAARAQAWVIAGAGGLVGAAALLATGGPSTLWPWDCSRRRWGH